MEQNTRLVAHTPEFPLLLIPKDIKETTHVHTQIEHVSSQHENTSTDITMQDASVNTSESDISDASINQHTVHKQSNNVNVNTSENSFNNDDQRTSIDSQATSVQAQQQAPQQHNHSEADSPQRQDATQAQEQALPSQAQLRQSARLAQKPRMKYTTQGFSFADNTPNNISIQQTSHAFTNLNIQTPQHPLDVTPENDVYVMPITLPPMHYLNCNVQVRDDLTGQMIRGTVKMILDIKPDEPIFYIVLENSSFAYLTYEQLLQALIYDDIAMATDHVLSDTTATRACFIMAGSEKQEVPLAHFKNATVMNPIDASTQLLGKLSYPFIRNNELCFIVTHEDGWKSMLTHKHMDEIAYGDDVHQLSFDDCLLTTHLMVANAYKKKKCRPLSMEEALKGPKGHLWNDALQTELDSWKQSHTYVEVRNPNFDIPPGQQRVHIYPSVTVLDIKRTDKSDKRCTADSSKDVGDFDGEHVDESQIKRKVRICVQGNVRGNIKANKADTFAATVPSVVILLMLSLAASMNFICTTLDFKSAFLTADLHEPTYMKPPRFLKRPADVVWKLLKSVYGLPQAARLFWKSLCNFFKGIGGSAIDQSRCVWKFVRDDVWVILALHVDDCLFLSNCKAFHDEIKKLIGENFNISKQGNVEDSGFLAMRIKRYVAENRITVDTQSHTHDMFQKFNSNVELEKLTNRVRNTPLPSGYKTELPVETAKPDDAIREPYRIMTGCAGFIAHKTRPDIAFAHHTLSRVMHCPAKQDLHAAQHLWSYLGHTDKAYLEYSNGCTKIQGTIDPNTGEPYVIPVNTLHAFIDSDHAGCQSTRRSTTGYNIWMNNGPIDWRVFLQSVVALSSMEAEYNGLSTLVAQIKYLRDLLDRMGFPQEGPTIIFMDNQAAEIVANEPRHSNRTKHIDIRFHYVQDAIDESIVRIVHVQGIHNRADIHTKNLEYNMHSTHRNAMVHGLGGQNEQR
jgi:hypothetical protein